MGAWVRQIERWDQHALSEMAGRVAGSEALAPFLKLFFRLRYWPRMKEAQRPPGGFRTLNDLFTRRLKSGARPIAEAPLVSAADGRFGACGRIDGSTLLQAKGRTYSVPALLHDDGDMARRLDGGSYVTVYLSPRDYHRFHAPSAGLLSRVSFVPGRLLPVNRGAVSSVDELFSRNERTIFPIESEAGPVVVVAVGAFLVAGVVVTAAPVPAPRDRRGAPFVHTFHRPAHLAKGQELGFFRFGSTVIVLAGPRFPPLVPLPAGSIARVGQALTE